MKEEIEIVYLEVCWRHPLCGNDVTRCLPKGTKQMTVEKNALHDVLVAGRTGVRGIKRFEEGNGNDIV